MDAIIGITSWRKVWMARGEWEYVPYAATWLNGERWEDELPATMIQVPVPTKLPEQGERTRMPDHVRELLAKLRK
jgi:hypothetical protein